MQQAQEMSSEWSFFLKKFLMFKQKLKLFLDDNRMKDVSEISMKSE